MKKIIKIIFIIIVGVAFLFSCEEKETNFASMYKDLDPNSNYYFQFVDPSKNFETKINEQGEPMNIAASIKVVVLGPVQSSATTVNMPIDASSTLTSSMHSLSTTSITIEAGKSSAASEFTVYADEMPMDVWLHLIINLDAGAQNAPTGATLNYKFKRIKFCPLEDLNDLVGSWTGKDSWDYPTQVVTFVDGGTGDFMINGLNVGWMTDYWGEVVVDQVPLIMIMNPNGTLEIELQYYMETTWVGDPQPTYSIAATGKWDNCKKTMIINYELWQGGEVLTTFTEDIALVTK